MRLKDTLCFDTSLLWDSQRAPFWSWPSRFATQRTGHAKHTQPKKSAELDNSLARSRRKILRSRVRNPRSI